MKNNNMFKYKKTYRKNNKNKKIKLIAIITIIIAFIVSVQFFEIQEIKQKTSQFVNYSLNFIGFGVQNVKITGNQNIEKNKIIKALNITKMHNRFNFDLHKTYSKIAAIPGVVQASISWRLPGEIYVNIIEAKPIALFFEKNGKYSLLAQNGDIIKSVDIKQYRHLPIVKGEGAQKYAPQFIRRLRTKPYIYALTQKIDRVRKKRWDIFLKNGILIMLPENDLEYALQTVEKLEKQNKILQIPLARIDLRVKGKVAVLPKNQKFHKYY